MSEGVTATFNATFFEDCDLGGRGILGAADNRAGVAHATTGRGGGAGDEASDGLGAICLDPARGLDLSITTDFTDENNPMRLGIRVEEFDHIEVIGPVDGVAADANAGGLANIF